MITALDTSVLLDVLTADPAHGRSSAAALAQARQEGAILACDVVWAETAAWFPSAAAATEAFDRIGLRFDPLDDAASALAGQSWRAYRRRGGTRERIVSDFLVAAHGRTAGWRSGSASARSPGPSRSAWRPWSRS